MKLKTSIYLSSWSVKHWLESGQISICQFPALAKEHGFNGVEFIDRHLPGTADHVFKKLLISLQENQMKSTLALTTDFIQRRPELLAKQIDYVIQMLNYAGLIRAQSVRILLGGSDFFLQNWIKRISRRKADSSQLDAIKRQKLLTSKLQHTKLFHWLHRRLIQNRKPTLLKDGPVRQNLYSCFDSIVLAAEKLRLALAIENHWSISGHSQNILDLVHYYNSAYLGTCPDLGNFSRRLDRYLEIKKLLPFAKEIHAKSYQFNQAGEETSIDYKQCVAMIQASKFSGPLVVEYEGSGDKFEHSLKTRDLLLKYL
ncbi:MAG: TIM barrel protein [bacterium]|nr:TIM barrel protein [bacterium]